MAVIDLQRGYAFIHVPKAAGTSIVAALVAAGGQQLSDDPALWQRVEDKRRALTGNAGAINRHHVRPWLLREVLGSDIYAELDSAAVVRSPWTRMRNTYDYQRQRPRDRVAPSVRELLDLSLSAFTVAMCERHTPPISRWLADRDGRLLVSTILRFEDLQSDFADWTSKVLGHSLDLPWLNRSTSGEGRFDSAAIAAVQQHFADDFDRFGYDREPPEPV